MREAAFGNEIEGAGELLFRLGGKAGDEVGPEDGIRAKTPHGLTEPDRIVAAVPALHALEDQVVAGLQREVEMRHQPVLAGNRLPESRVGLDGIDGGQAQAREIRHVAEDRLDQPSQAG